MPSSNLELNYLQLIEVAKSLGDLVNDVVFVGGCTTALLVDQSGAEFVRRTEDVDIIVDLLSLSDLYAFGDKLRACGFSEDTSDDSIICRWTIPYLSGRLKVDVMPTDPNLLGFSNRWYPDAIKHSNRYSLPGEWQIKVVSPTYFLATKFEAFHGRGKGDYFSHDLEDIVYLLEHSARLIIILLDAPPAVKSYLANEARKLINSEFRNVLPGLLNSPNNAPAILNTLRQISELR